MRIYAKLGCSQVQNSRGDPKAGTTGWFWSSRQIKPFPTGIAALAAETKARTGCFNTSLRSAWQADPLSYPRRWSISNGADPCWVKIIVAKNRLWPESPLFWTRHITVIALVFICWPANWTQANYYIFPPDYEKSTITSFIMDGWHWTSTQLSICQQSYNWINRPMYIQTY